MSKPTIKAEIIKIVRNAEDNFFRGVKFSQVSRRFNRAAARSGLSLRTLVEELDKENKIFLFMDADGAMLLMAPEVREQIKLDISGTLDRESLNMIMARWGRSLVRVEESANA